MIAHHIGPIASSYLNTNSDALFSNVGLLSEFYANSVTDLSGLAQTIDNIGGVVRKSGSAKQGISNMKSLSGSDGLVRANNNTAMDVGSGDFTIEFWIKRDTSPANTNRLAGRYSTSGTTNRGYYFHYTTAGTGVLNFSVGNAAGGAIAGTASFRFGTDGLANIFDGTWHHVAAVRDGSTVKIFVDGLVGGVTYTVGTNAIAQSAGTYFMLGGTQGSTLTSYATPTSTTEFDEVRFTLGVARYSAFFTPPSALPLNISEDANFDSVKLLLNFEQYFSFFSVGTYVGEFQPQPTSNIVPFDSNGLFKTSASNTGLYFPTATEFNLGSSDFTLEVFGYYSTASTANTAVLGCWHSSTGMQAWRLTRRTSTTLSFSYTTDGTTVVDLDFAVTLANSTYYDIAVVRSGSTLYLYVDGTLSATHAFAVTIFNSFSAGVPLAILHGVNNVFSGSGTDAASTTTRVRGLRLTNNHARYTGSSYTVPTLPLPKS